MTAEKENIHLFGAALIAETTFNNVRFRLYENRIFHVVVPEFHKIGIDIIEYGYGFLDDNGGGTYHNIFQFESFSDVEPEIRKWAANKEGNNYTLSDAIVIGSLPQKIITDFYLKFDRPVKPTKVFYSLDKALEWTFNEMTKHNL